MDVANFEHKDKIPESLPQHKFLFNEGYSVSQHNWLFFLLAIRNQQEKTKKKQQHWLSSYTHHFGVDF